MAVSLNKMHRECWLLLPRRTLLSYRASWHSDRKQVGDLSVWSAVTVLAVQLRVAGVEPKCEPKVCFLPFPLTGNLNPCESTGWNCSVKQPHGEERRPAHLILALSYAGWALTLGQQAWFPQVVCVLRQVCGRLLNQFIHLFKST